MSSSGPVDPTRAVATGGAKKKTKNKKKNANKTKDPIEEGNGQAAEDKDENLGENLDEPETPVQTVPDDTPAPESTDQPETNPDRDMTQATNGHPPGGVFASLASDAAVKLQAMTEDREALRAEIEKYRKQIEDLQTSHASEVKRLTTELEESNTAKENAEEEYETLRERVEKIKATLSDRLKRDREELEESKDRVEELEGQNEELRNNAAAADEEVRRLKEELQEAAREAASLRSRSNLSSTNWLREKDELIKTVAHLKEEVQMTTNAMGEWEVIAMEERAVKEGLDEKVAELEGQVSTIQEAYDNAVSDRDTQAQALENLQRALQELQEARRKELREAVEQVQTLENSLQAADAKVLRVQEEKERLVLEVERCMPFEKEVKEKNLLIGKLRHEAIVLNDHLTKALRYLKKTKPEDNVDRQIVTNHFLHFITLDRADPKRFQILQVIAGYLNWSDEQREQAGLARPGTSASSLKLPLSPFNRTPSTASLNSDFMTGPSSAGAGKETLAELWAGFLERSAEEGADERSRKDSASSAATVGTRPDVKG
ncbi:related to RUD3 - suppressor of uso1-1 transport defect [Cephalotrichum gorgonifer]|uniref:Related to RUD3 - suppressor of uso1-1 transport defect n=1 Tax=Cephalotrichum gorgonifer TaxID=2041049 RepID=A0AAE8SWW6_9PEZI|nr:related to RUD3 - suppressor of uso1-1 transport defect [Cephalotrichum gorgonifer]